MNYNRHRSLPLRVQPGDGEALDSWLLRLAHRNGISARWLLGVLGLNERIRVWHNHTLVRGLPYELLRRLEVQTGLNPHRLDQAVLDRYEELGWKPTVGSRYCAACLTDTGGAWPIRWQLPYTFACLQHQCLLAGVCPACHQTPHSSLSDQSGLLPLHQCTIRPHKGGGVCGAELRTHPIHHLTPDDPRLSAQQWINQRLDIMDGSARTDLRDLDALGTWLRQRIGPDDIEHLGQSTMDAVARCRDPRYHYGLRRQQPTTPIVTAAIASHVIDLMTADDEQTRYRLFSPLFRDAKNVHQPRSAAPPQAPMILSRRRMTKLSATLQHRLLTSCDPHLPVSERLRYRTCTATPQVPTPEATTSAERARYVPQYLWPDWIVRFLPPAGAHVDALATAIPVALMIPGNPVRNTHATAELNRWHNNVSQTLRLLFEHHHDALSAICALADYLDTHGAPIDYRRRRATFPDVVLPRQEWEILCERADAHPGKATRQLQARQYLFQLLTGADLSNPQHTLAFRSPLERSYYLDFQHSLITPLRDELQQHAAQTLQAAGFDEPLTWTPPPSCVSGLTLPGRDPLDIDMDALHDLLIVAKTCVKAAATRLGVTVEHVRHAQQRLHRPAPAHPQNSPVTARKVRARAAVTLTAEFFQREHIQVGKDLDVITAETGISRKLLIHHARQSGIKLVGVHQRPRRSAPARRRAHIDPGWLREHAGTRQRANGDIGAELGLSHETIRRHRKNLNLPSRPTGSLGHVVTHLRHPQLPKEIRLAVEGQRHGWQRLRRFKEIQAFPSMNTAAHCLHVHTSNLNLQIQRLEADLGKKLLNRGHRYLPMTPTGHGRRLLHQLDRPDVQELLELFAGKHPPKSRAAEGTAQPASQSRPHPTSTSARRGQPGERNRRPIR